MAAMWPVALRTRGRGTHLRCKAKEKGRARGGFIMDRGLFFIIGDFFSTFGSAASASRAVEAGRKPRAADLKKLGIDPAAFDRIGRF
jgi:hypothetical protein